MTSGSCVVRRACHAEAREREVACGWQASLTYVPQSTAHTLPFSMSTTKHLSLWLLGAAFVGLAVSARAYPYYYNAWNSYYPNSLSDDNVIAGHGQACGVCHSNPQGGEGWNAYGWQLRQSINLGQDINSALASAESLDSDGDPAGSSNLDEISMHAQPGWTSGPNNTLHTSSGSLPGQLPLANIAGRLDPDCAASIQTYCNPKPNSLGCTPAIGTTGLPSASAGSGFVVSATQVLNNKSGLLFYGTSGRGGAAFQGGTLCVSTPIKRTPAVTSGGNPPPNDCSGVLSIDMNAFAVGALGGTPLAALSSVGTTIYCQWWGRDPGFVAPNNTTLSGGLEYVVCP